MRMVHNFYSSAKPLFLKSVAVGTKNDTIGVAAPNLSILNLQYQIILCFFNTWVKPKPKQQTVLMWLNFPKLDRQALR